MMTIDENVNTTDETTDDAVVTHTTSLNTDVHGPNQREDRVWSGPEKAYESFNETALARERDQAVFDQEREQISRFANGLHEQALRHTEELFQQRLRQQDDLHVVTVQSLSNSQVADSGIGDAVALAVLNALNTAGVVTNASK